MRYIRIVDEITSPFFQEQCHCERSEAISLGLARCSFRRDCFATLAMTAFGERISSSFLMLFIGFLGVFFLIVHPCVGIEPDIEIALSDEDYKALRQQLPDDRMVVTSEAASTDEPEAKVEDVQLKEALTVLRGYVLLASQEKPEEEPEPASPEEVM